METCDAILFLPGYEASLGSLEEFKYNAKHLHLPFYKDVNDVPNILLGT